MKNVNLQKLIEKAGKMALDNIWDESAYEVNMAILKVDHNNCAAYTRLAKYYKLNGNMTEAKSMYLKTLEINPNNRGAINNLNDIEEEQNENDAVDKVKTTGELLKEGQKAMLKGKYKLAVKLFLKAYSIEPLLMNAISLAGAYKKLGKYYNIEKLYKQFISDNHTQADIETIHTEFKLLGVNV